MMKATDYLLKSGVDYLLKSTRYQLILSRTLKTTPNNEKLTYSTSINIDPQPITVTPDPKLFDDISPIYEKMIKINTFGQHTNWRKSFAKHLAPFDNIKILDAAGGTGLTTIAILNEAAKTKCKPNFSINICDQSSSMMKIGQKKIKDRHDYNKLVNFVQTDVHNLPFKSNTFDLAVLTFSFRTGLDVFATLKELSRVVKPGGRVGIMDFCYSNNPTMIQLSYNLFLDHIYSRIANLLWKKPEVGYYMADSIRRIPSENELVEMLKAVGFHQISTKSYMGGINYHYIGHKIKNN